MIEPLAEPAGVASGQAAVSGARPGLGRAAGEPGSPDGLRGAGASPTGSDGRSQAGGGRLFGLGPDQVDRLITELKGTIKDGSCLSRLDQIAAIPWEKLTRSQCLGLIRLFEQVATACHAKAADLSAYLTEMAGGDESSERAVTSLIASATSATEGEVMQLTQIGQRRQASEALKNSLDTGKTTFSGAKAMANETKHLDPADAANVIDSVLADQGATNSNRQRKATRQAVEEKLAHTREQRHAKARTERRVVIEPVANGMSWLKGLIPSFDATAIYQQLHHQAENTPHKNRTLRQVEADLFAQYLLGSPGSSRAPGPDAGLPAEPAGPTPKPSASQSPRSSKGLFPQPSKGPFPQPGPPANSASSSQPEAMVSSQNPPRPSKSLSPKPGPPTNSASSSQPEAMVSSQNPPRPSGVAARQARILAMVQPQTLQSVMEQPTFTSRPAVLTPEVINASRVLVNVIPGSPILAPGRQPDQPPPRASTVGKLSGEPPGYVSALLVGCGSVLEGDQLAWLVRQAHHQAIVVHPKSGRLITLGARPVAPGGRLAAPLVTWDWDSPATWPAEATAGRTYQPTDWLALMVMIRDQTCRWPGCVKPATMCHIDHHQPFSLFRAASQQTIASNLGCLCVLHHRIKHQDRWTTRRDPYTGVTTWAHSSGLTKHSPPVSLQPD